MMPEELIKEIRDVYKAGKENRLPDKSPSQIIRLVLSAVRDGRLDEELRVVGRWEWPKSANIENRDWMARMLHDDASTFIALRKEEGK